MKDPRDRRTGFCIFDILFCATFIFLVGLILAAILSELGYIPNLQYNIFQ